VLRETSRPPVELPRSTAVRPAARVAPGRVPRSARLAAAGFRAGVVAARLCAAVFFFAAGFFAAGFLAADFLAAGFLPAARPAGAFSALLFDCDLAFVAMDPSLG